LGQQYHSNSEGKNDSPYVNFIKNCEHPASWRKRLSASQRNLAAKDPHKLDLNYEFSKDVAGSKF